MANTDIFFGIDTGRTRKTAKMTHKRLGGAAAALVNINCAMLVDLLACPILPLGTPMLGDGQLPGLEAGGKNESWAEFIRNLGDVSLQGKTVALFGLGDQRGYPDSLASGLRPPYGALRARGATMVGSWPSERYKFDASSALERDRFVGLALDQDNQFDETDARLAAWLEEIKPHLLQAATGSLSATRTAPANTLASRPATGAGGGAGSVD